MKLVLNYNKIFILLLITSVFLTVSIFIVIPFRSVFNFSTLIIFSLLILFILKRKIQIGKNEMWILFYFILLILYGLLLLPTYNTEVVEFLNYRPTRKIFSGEAKSYYSETKRGVITVVYFIYACITLFVCFQVIKKVNKQDLILITSKYVHFFCVVYLSIYILFIIGIDLTYFISTNTYYQFKNFLTSQGEFWNRESFSLFPVRLGITLPEPSYSGMYMLLLYPFTAKLLAYRSYTRILLILCILLTASKFAITFLVILIASELFIKYIFKYTYQVVLLILGLLLISYFILPNLYELFYDKSFKSLFSSQTYLTRIESMKVGLEMSIKNLPFGVGPGRFPFNFEKYKYVSSFKNFEGYYPNNAYILYFAEYGIIMIPLYLYFIYGVIKSLFKNDKFLFTMGISIMLVFITNGFFYHTYFILFLTIMHYLLHEK